ncbi:MAG TPA: hypothetical protein ENJ27_01310 [Candidatus Moranbacteria bacterium]|nr:hypothetical protein [Candidatus Moranbacteria bacterium]
MRDTGERHECKCGQIFSGPTSKLEFLKHQTECSCREECDDKVVIVPELHENITNTWSCLVTMYHDGYKVASFSISPEGSAAYRKETAVSYVKRVIESIKKAEIVVKED